MLIITTTTTTIINLAQDSDQWWAFVSMVMTLQVPLKGEEFFD
jgi:hypothetical protein